MHEVVTLEQRRRKRRTQLVVQLQSDRQRDAAHVLDAAADRHVVDAARDQRGGEVDRLLRRPALAVDRRRRRLDRESGLKPRVPADVRRLLAVLLNAAGDDVLHLAGIDACAPQHLDEDDAEQLVRMDVFVVALFGMSAAYRCANGFDDDDLTPVHASPLYVVTNPPLGLSVAPTKNPASSLARKATVPAISSGRPNRPSGVRSRSAALTVSPCKPEVAASM